VPLTNVVLAAIPAEAAGGASGIFSTAQQLGGALGVAIIGTVFFSRAAQAGLTEGFWVSMPLIAGAFVLCGVLSLTLPPHRGNQRARLI
jgi:predicted MFS family arabinose efflux permease